MSLVAELVKFCSRDFAAEAREAAKKPVSLGPWGGNGGHKWTFNEEGKGFIKQIMIIHGDAIDSLTFTVEIDGKTFSKKIGGRGGSVRKTVDIDVPGEYLTDIEGYLRPAVVSTTVLNAIKFVTNVREYGPFGTQDGSKFTLPVKNGMIVGFHGRAGDIIDSIGVYMKPG